MFDGSGAPARRADVLVADGRIEKVGEIAADPDIPEVNLEGLALAPGFIDIHTHYDAQVLWDPDLTPSCWHGVTSVVMGNCGFGVAPTRAEHREMIAYTLENVEGMSADALVAGIPWDFETFPEYLDSLDRRPKRLNVGAMIGHTPLRLYVLGDDAIERPATDSEIEQMREIVAEALAAGALGFATSKSPTHAGAGGRPVPSRLAETDEVFRIADALGDVDESIMQITPGPGLGFEQMSELSVKHNKPVTWTALLAGLGKPGTATSIANKIAEMDGEIWPQIACRPLVMQVALEDPFPIAPLAAIQKVLAVPREERSDIYADPEWRAEAAPQVDMMWGRRYPKMAISESEAHPDLIGRTVGELAEERGVAPFELMCTLSLDDNLKTRFTVVLLNDDEEEIASLLGLDNTVLGLSDAGAHASQLCDACFSTYLLGHWVRERKTLSLEQAVWRLAGQPAEIFRLEGRGFIREGYIADLVAFDPETVGAKDAERVYDFPAGADRLIVQSTGVEHMWIGGTQIRRDGVDIEGVAPGVLLRR